MFIDPMLNSSHRGAASLIREGEKVLDVACGTGALPMLVARISGTHITGIDTDNRKLRTADRIMKRKGVKEYCFVRMDATDMSQFENNQIDVAIISMAIHQFSRTDGLTVLSEMKRVAHRIIVVDYGYPLRSGFLTWLTWTIEFIAGGDHFRNFRSYMSARGIDSLLDESGLVVEQRHLRGKGTLVISSCLLNTLMRL